MKRDSFSVLFFLKKNQLLKNGDAPVSMRVTVNGLREEVRTKKSINPTLWNQAKECSRARDKKSRDLNDYIEDARLRLAQLFQEMEQAGKNVTAKNLLVRFFGADEENNRTLLTVFKEHNAQCARTGANGIGVSALWFPAGVRPYQPEIYGCGAWFGGTA